jgi:hypothetical protein
MAGTITKDQSKALFDLGRMRPSNVSCHRLSAYFFREMWLAKHDRARSIAQPAKEAFKSKQRTAILRHNSVTGSGNG